METPAENKALQPGARLLIVGGRGMLVNPDALNAIGDVVRPDLMPLYLKRPNRRERRKQMRSKSKRQY